MGRGYLAIILLPSQASLCLIREIQTGIFISLPLAADFVVMAILVMACVTQKLTFASTIHWVT